LGDRNLASVHRADAIPCRWISRALRGCKTQRPAPLFLPAFTFSRRLSPVHPFSPSLPFCLSSFSPHRREITSRSSPSRLNPIGLRFGCSARVEHRTPTRVRVSLVTKAARRHSQTRLAGRPAALLVSVALSCTRTALRPDASSAHAPLDRSTGYERRLRVEHQERSAVRGETSYLVVTFGLRRRAE